MANMAMGQSSQTTFTSCMHDQMLESNRDDVKLEAMRCVTVMTAKGKLSVPRTLFPHIVKNVSSKNPELKKLIYLYLTNFADQEPDLALLPVAALQKSLKSPNPLIRSSALKVLTSMRLNILSAILMATLRNSVNDLSPYVRKTVAHSIIKIYHLDQSLKGDLIGYMERLLDDKNSMVLSSALATFEVVCPKRLDLILKHYRRYCFILADCNEWGQTLMLNLLCRCVLYATKGSKNSTPDELDPKILLRSAKPLVHSHNSAVVIAVIKLYIALANNNEVRTTITKPLLRLLNLHREIQLVVLDIIEKLTALRASSNIMDSATDLDDVEDKQEIEEVEFKKCLSDQIKLKLDNNANDHKSITNDDSPNHIAGAPDEEKASLENKSRPNDDVGEGDGEESSKYEEDSEDESDEEEEDEDEEEEEDEEKSDDADEEEALEGEESDKVRAKRNSEGYEEHNVEVSSKESHMSAESDKEDDIIEKMDSSSKLDSQAYREMFRPYIKSFFIKHTDCTQVRLAKLRILTNLSAPVNVAQTLKELQAYVSIYVDDKEFVSAVVHAMGNCATIVAEVAHICLTGLTSLLSNNNEHVVSEAIVVLRSQIINKKSAKTKLTENRKNQVDEQANQKTSENQSEDDENQQDLDGNQDDKMVSAVIKQVTKLLPTVTAPQARATILWILADFCDKNKTAAKCTPNVLRFIAKSFCQEDSFVKLQGLTLVSKFLLSLDKESKATLYSKVQLLAGYLFSLAKYDMNHDVRDRGRFLKKMLENEDICIKVLCQ